MAFKSVILKITNNVEFSNVVPRNIQNFRLLNSSFPNDKYTEKLESFAEDISVR